MTEVNNAFDEPLPEVDDIPSEPEPELGWQKLKVVSASAELIGKDPAKQRKGLKLVVAAVEQPGTRRIFTSITFPTATEIKIAMDVAAAIQSGTEEKAATAARLTATKYRHFIQRLEEAQPEDSKVSLQGLTPSALAKAVEDAPFYAIVEKRKYKDKDGNQKEALDVNLLKDKPKDA